MNIGFVFTNFNNAKYTKDAVESIQKFNKSDVKIVIVDNNSKEEDIAKLKELNIKYLNIEIIYSNENVGYFSGLNIGIKFLRETYPEYNYLVIGNNDVLFPMNFIEQIENKLNLFEKYPVVSPNIVTLDGFHQNPHVISGISKKREFIYDLYHSNFLLSKLIIKLSTLTHSFTDRKDEEQYEIAQEIYQGYGAMYILGPKFFENFDELWSPTFLLYEEYFLSKQLSDKGFKIFYEPSIELTHLMHATTNLLPAKIKWEFSRKAHKTYRQYIKVFK
jgi:GT2 family glycosyltransferase